MANNSPQTKQVDHFQAKPVDYTAPQQQSSLKKASPEPGGQKNNTGLPDNLKSGIENLSGYSMDDVKVHYNSDKPAQLNAHAYAQGTDIYLASGQEKHLPHEAWHVVQQKQARIKPTMQMKGGVQINNDKGLEKEADVMGKKAIQALGEPNLLNNSSTTYFNQKPVQRVVVDDVVNDENNPKVLLLLDKFNRQVESVQTIAAYIFTTRYRENEHAIMPNFDDLYDAVDKVYESSIAPFVFSEELIPISHVAAETTKIAHQEWLKGVEGQEVRKSLPTHEELQEKTPPFFQHYNLFDNNMIWRWTSKPSTEQIYTALKDDKGTNITNNDIIKVVAAHSGGNDKSNPYVKTLSFGRNPAALMGVAASIGGDKHVLNIIDKTEYLYGIDITSLASKGITAHAATTRMISLFESEYVLVNTPGFPSFSLDELATKKYKNPFKGRAITEMLNDNERSIMQIIEREMGVVEPETVNEAEDIEVNFAQRILDNAKKAKNAANPLSSVVRDKETLDPNVAKRALSEFNRSLGFRV
ncbi:MAG: DUF4157 domain-containing protein [Okeania sp. SIO1I7]|nr:DUF4157 domain-containing protein [Okeania sp. SIO1I7]